MSEKRYNFSFVGDIKIDEKTLQVISRKKEEGINIFTGLENTDLIFANLEAPITDGSTIRENKIYYFKSPKKVADLFDDRFVLSIANNHIMDFGEEGLRDTINILKEKNIPFAGSGNNLLEAAKPVIKKINDKLIGIICCADSRFQSAGENKAGNLPAKFEVIKPIIKELKAKVDLIIVSIHAGIEFINLPSKRHINFAEMCIKEGAKIINFHHAHVVSGFTKNEDSIIFYGTGNYIFPNSLKLYKNFSQSAVWKIYLDDLLKITDFKITPVMLDEYGMPQLTNEKESKNIVRKIDRFSNIISSSKKLFLWQIFYMLNIFYLGINFRHYAILAKKIGIKKTFLMILSGIKMHFFKK